MTVAVYRVEESNKESSATVIGSRLVSDSFAGGFVPERAQRSVAGDGAQDRGRVRADGGPDDGRADGLRDGARAGAAARDRRDCSASETGSGAKNRVAAIYRAEFIDTEAAMALSIRDPDTDRLARELAKLTGESMTGAIRVALEQRLAREKRRREADLERRRARINAIVERVAKLPVLDDRSPEEILGYDENGLPT
jgi:antitoxin VapB